MTEALSGQVFILRKNKTVKIKEYDLELMTGRKERSDIMLNEMIETILKQVKEEYPHIETPGAVKANITAVNDSGKKYVEEVTLTDKATGEAKEYVLEKCYYQYTVQPVDNRGNVLDNYPPIPGILSDKKYDVGSQVSIVFTGGELYPSIVGD
jgi:hypothetical protein